jgi:(E)-4-hydroxy-3-methylbut-2-enyl-diphosphate synthase
MSLSIKRKKTRRIMVGGVAVGDGAPISVQSMTNTKTDDVTATVRQIQQLAQAGCEIVRVAVPDQIGGGCHRPDQSADRHPPGCRHPF